MLFLVEFKFTVTAFQSYCDSTCIRSVTVLPHWNTHGKGTPPSHIVLTPGQPVLPLLSGIDRGASSTNCYPLFVLWLGIKPATVQTHDKRSISWPFHWYGNSERPQLIESCVVDFCHCGRQVLFKRQYNAYSAAPANATDSLVTVGLFFNANFLNFQLISVLWPSIGIVWLFQWIITT